MAPGGTGYPANKLACSSCHDPHGKYRRDSTNTVSTTGLPIFNSGSYASSKEPIAGIAAVGVYRLLGGIGYQPKSITGPFAFMNSPPIAVVNSTYNRSEASGQTHVAYGQGMGEWCGNCHGAMHLDTYVSGTPKLVHPAGNGAKLTAVIAANYNSYVSSGIMTNTDPLKAYSSLAPFESGEDYSAIASLKSKAVNT
ncbi:MAG: omcS-2, partial [Myxococcaceae bacterium]|nr:omcS-2 [Myxococcaceae bacterium]